MDSAFRGDVPLDDYLFEPFYQLLRLRLLADEIRRSGFAPGVPVRDARVVVVCPAANEDYRLAVASTPLARRFPALPTVERIMQATLRDPTDLVIVGSEMLVQALRASPVAPDISDPFAKPAQYPPVGLYCRGDLDPEGHDIGTLAGMVAELDPGRFVHGRVYVPVPMPGGASGCWMRGLWRLREALWDGRIGEDEAGWVVMDGWTGTVSVVGATLTEAFEAWNEAVAAAQPLPPRDPKPAPMPDVPDEAPSSEYDEEKKTARFSTGTVHLVFVPRVTLDWPDARPENVPAIAVRLAPASPIPAGWEGYGITRRLRLIGEHGDVCTAFVRDEGDGAFTLIGEGAIPALDPTTLDAELDRIDDDRRRDIEETWFPGRPSPYTNPEYPWMSPGYRAWDDLGRSPKLREGGIGWTAEVVPRDLDADHLRWMVKRARRSSMGQSAANRPF